MLSTQKLMQMANENFNNEYLKKGTRLYDKTSYLSGYYDGYLMGQPKKRKNNKTTIGKLANVGIGVNKNVVSE